MHRTPQIGCCDMRNETSLRPAVVPRKRSGTASRHSVDRRSAPTRLQTNATRHAAVDALGDEIVRVARLHRHRTVSLQPDRKLALYGALALALFAFSFALEVSAQTLITIDAAKDRHPISRNIYGLAFATPEQ